MANHIITITDGDPVTGVLTLDDRGETDVDPSDTVQWNIQPSNPNRVNRVASITSIVRSNEEGSIDVFNGIPQPFPLTTSAVWKGTISDTIARGSIEKYFINWDPISGGATLRHDPIIKVKPSGK